MSLKKCAALLLLIGVITAGHTADTSECDFSNKTSSDLNYQMSISPEVLYNDTVYTVNVTSNRNGSVTVLLQALSNNTAAGTWSLNGSSSCIGGPLLNYTFVANKSLIANWTSPSPSIPDSVDLIVSIRDGNMTYKLSKTLHTGSASAASSIQPYSMFLALIETLSLLVITSKLL
ncbi:uncharacterized protein LOC143934464 [Lithobates pipiens]